jgi:hypothetical protein
LVSFRALRKSAVRLKGFLIGLLSAEPTLAQFCRAKKSNNNKSTHVQRINNSLAFHHGEPIVGISSSFALEEK